MHFTLKSRLFCFFVVLCIHGTVWIELVSSLEQASGCHRVRSLSNDVFGEYPPLRNIIPDVEYNYDNYPDYLGGVHFLNDEQGLLICPNDSPKVAHRNRRDAAENDLISPVPCGANCTSKLGPGELVIVSYNDVYDINMKANKVGGASRVAQYVANLKAQMKHVLVLFAGDTLSPSLFSRLFKGQQMIDAHNAIGVDYACLGNHDFDFGVDAFLDAASRSNFIWLNANTYENSTKKLLRKTIPRHIKIINGVRVGFFGVMYDMGKNSHDLYWTDPIEAATEQVSLLRKEGAQMIIALTHQEWKDDNRFSTSVKGVDMIIGGHDHESMCQRTFGTRYFKADSDWATIWVHLIKTQPKISFPSSVLKSITSDMPTSPVVEDIIRNYTKLAEGPFDVEIGESLQELDATQEVVRRRESVLANYISDVMKDAYSNSSKTEIALINGGAIRSNTLFPAGKIKRRDIVSWIPFGNYIYSTKINGSILRNLLEVLLGPSCDDAKTVKNNGEYVHPSGFSYVFECTGPELGQITQLRWRGEGGYEGKREIGDGEHFLMATVDYIYDRFKLHIDPLGDNRVVDGKFALRLDDVLERAIKEAGTINPFFEGRSRVEPYQGKLE